MSKRKIAAESQLCWSYAELVDRVRQQLADPGLLSYYAFFTGSFDTLLMPESLDRLKELYYSDASSSASREALTAFAHSCILLNLGRMTNYALNDVKQMIDDQSSLDLKELKVYIPSPATLNLCTLRKSYSGIEDNIERVYTSLVHDGILNIHQVTSTDLLNDKLSLMVEMLQGWHDWVSMKAVTYPNRGEAVMNANKVFKTAIILRTMLLGLNLQDIQTGGYDLLSGGSLTEDLPRISDMTLAALPRPTADLIAMCEDTETISSRGILYLKMYRHIAGK